MSFASHLRIRRLGEFTVGHRPAALRLAGARAAADPLPRGHGAGRAGDRRLAAAGRAARRHGRGLRAAHLDLRSMLSALRHGRDPHTAGVLPDRRAARLGHRRGGGAGGDPALGVRGGVGARARAGRDADRAGGAHAAADGRPARPTRPTRPTCSACSSRARGPRARWPSRSRARCASARSPPRASTWCRSSSRRSASAIPSSRSASTWATASWCSQRVLEHEVDVAVTGRIPDDERLFGHDFADNEFALDHRAGRPAGAAPLGGGGGAGRAALAGARAGLGHADAGGGVPGQPRHRAAAAHAGLQRRDQAGGAHRPRRGAAVARGGGAGARAGPLATISPRGGLPSRRWHVVRSAVGPVREDVEAFMAFCRSPAARHALGGA